jgi:hypothetical protein
MEMFEEALMQFRTHYKFLGYGFSKNNFETHCFEFTEAENFPCLLYKRFVSTPMLCTVTRAFFENVTQNVAQSFLFVYGIIKKEALKCFANSVIIKKHPKVNNPLAQIWSP